MILDFGIYNGQEIEEVPSSYLLYLYAQPWFKQFKPKVYNYIKYHKKNLQLSLIEEDTPWFDDLYQEIHFSNN